MGNNTYLRTLARGSVLLTMAIVAQEIRLFLPLPPLLSIIVIGTMLNAIMVIAVRYASLTSAIIISAVLPLFAFMQGHVIIPLMIPVIFLGNFVLVLVCDKFWGKGIIILAPVLKTVTLYMLSRVLLSMLGLQNKVVDAILLGMGWPQLITAILGIILAMQLEKRLIFVKK
ncbi:MAG: hypothetical protein KBH36_03640 [Acidaminococcaceae bacterium]|nr:hypothetical protein [Acidaminococcaceae bacterium]